MIKRIILTVSSITVRKLKSQRAMARQIFGQNLGECWAQTFAGHFFGIHKGHSLPKKFVSGRTSGPYSGQTTMLDVWPRSGPDIPRTVLVLR